MSSASPTFNQVSLVVEDIGAALAFYRTLTGSGYLGRQEPYDAFFGARYAVVRDPAGNDDGLMSPIDQRRRFTPTT